MRGELHRITLWVVGAVVILGLMYYFLVHRYMKPDKPDVTPAAPPAA